MKQSKTEEKGEKWSEFASNGNKNEKIKEASSYECLERNLRMVDTFVRRDSIEKILSRRATQYRPGRQSSPFRAHFCRVYIIDIDTFLSLESESERTIMITFFETYQALLLG